MGMPERERVDGDRMNARTKKSPLMPVRGRGRANANIRLFSILLVAWQRHMSHR